MSSEEESSTEEQTEEQSDTIKSTKSEEVPPGGRAKSRKNVMGPIYAYVGMELIMLICFAMFTEYSDDLSISNAGFMQSSQFTQSIIYPYFQDIHIMIFIGFGFLMSFLRTHSWSSVSLNMLIAAYTFQLTILVLGLMNGFLSGEQAKIQIDLVSLCWGDFGAAVVLITFGVLLGKVDAVQMLVIATIEIIAFAFAEEIVALKIQASDMGGSMVVHTFGAYFGLACSARFSNKTLVKKWKRFYGGDYNSQLMAMVGTVFLFCYWPSFNGVLAGGNSQMRVVCNTVLSETAAIMAAFGMSSYFHKGRFCMDDVLNTTLAGGVMVGTASDMCTSPWQPLIIGFFAGVICSAGFNGKLPDIGIDDSCGVQYLHGIPGIIGGLIGVVFALVLKVDGVETIFPAMDPAGEGRSNSDQAVAQLTGLGIYLIISIVTGAIAGEIAGKMQMPEPHYHDQFHFDADECAYTPSQGNVSKITSQRNSAKKKKKFVVAKEEDSD